MRRRRTAIRGSTGVTFVIAASLAVAGGIAAYAASLWASAEHRTVDVRFSLRHASTPGDVLLVAIDGSSLSALKASFPLPRSYPARAIDRLRADGARAIVYDLQFTEPTRYSEDRALLDAVARDGRRVVLATTETNARGQPNVLGGPAVLAPTHATVAAANMPADGDGVIRRYPYSIIGLPSVAVAAAQIATGRPVSHAGFESSGALIDFRGAPGTIRTVHFSDLLAGRVSSSTVAGHTVVVAVTAPTLGDFHTAATAHGEPMSGGELLANSIWTAEQGNPLRSAPGWLSVILVMAAGLAAPLLWLRFAAPKAAVAAVAIALTYLVAAQLAFYSGTVLVVTYPIFALALGTFTMLTAGYVAETVQKREASRRAGELAVSVRERDRQLQEAQIEIVTRLAQAAESRDEVTGMHIVRIGNLCHRVGLEMGMTALDAELLRHASAMHDIGKIAIPDHILRMEGNLSDDEWEVMKSHAARGAAILAGSSSPLVRMGETIALTHHERWDGRGYPQGLRGEQIPLVGRIAAVCDVFDALMSARPYKEAWTAQDAVAEVCRHSGTQFDPRVVEALIKVLDESADMWNGEQGSAPGAAAPARRREAAGSGEPGKGARSDAGSAHEQPRTPAGGADAGSQPIEPTISS